MVKDVVVLLKWLFAEGPNLSVSAYVKQLRDLFVPRLFSNHRTDPEPARHSSGRVRG
jgi:hypothetical protein